MIQKTSPSLWQHMTMFSAIEQFRTGYRYKAIEQLQASESESQHAAQQSVHWTLGILRDL